MACRSPIPMPSRTRRRWSCSGICPSLGADAQDLDLRRREQDFAEAVHPVAGFFGRADAPVAELVELFQLLQLHLELQRRAVLAARERHEQPRVEALGARSFDLAAYELQ